MTEKKLIRRKKRPRGANRKPLPKVTREDMGLESGTPRGQTGSKVDALSASADTAVRLLQDIKAHRLDPKDLSPGQRRACLVLCAHGTMTSTELAVMFRTTPSTIRMDLKKIREEVGRDVKTWTLAEVLGDLSLVAEKTTAMALKAEDPGLAWSIRRDMAKMLKELGVIGQEADKGGFKLTIEAMGQGYERTKEALKLAMNSKLTGMIDEPTPSPVKAIPLNGTLGDQDPEDSFAISQTPEDEGSPDPTTAAPPKKLFGFE